MGKSGKKAKRRQEETPPPSMKDREAGATPKIAEDGGPTDDLPPVFSFAFLQKGYSFKDCTGEQCRALLATLDGLGKRTWAELRLLDRHKAGSEQLPVLQDKLPAELEGSIPLAFRFWDMAPLIGVRRDQIFYLVWIDPKMRLYKH